MAGTAHPHARRRSRHHPYHQPLQRHFPPPLLGGHRHRAQDRAHKLPRHLRHFLPLQDRRGLFPRDARGHLRHLRLAGAAAQVPPQALPALPLEPPPRRQHQAPRARHLERRRREGRGADLRRRHEGLPGGRILPDRRSREGNLPRPPLGAGDRDRGAVLIPERRRGARAGGSRLGGQGALRRADTTA